MKICAIILARGESKGIPNKNSIEIKHLPLVAHSILQAKKSKFIGENVYVSSDSDNILNISKRYGAKTIKRPAELAQDDTTSEDSLKHSIEATGINWDIVVFLQPTSILRKEDDIDNAIKGYLATGADSLFSASKLPEDYLIWMTKGDTLLSSYNIDNRKRRQTIDINQFNVENGSIYIFKPKNLFSFNNRLHGKIIMYHMEYWQQYEIDEYDDLGLVEFMLNRYNLPLWYIN